MAIDNRQIISRLTSRPARILAPLLVFACALGIGASRIRDVPNVYSASERLWVQRANPFADSRGPEPGEIPESPLMEQASNLVTFCEVVSSAAVLDIAYEELGKKLPANKMPDRSDLSSVRVTPEKDVNIINVEFRSDDPDVAQAVVDCVVNAFMKENALQIAGPLEDTKERLEKQLAMARDEYNASKGKMRQFSAATASINFAEETAMLTTQRAEMEHDLDEAQHELTALRTKIDYIQKQLGFGPDDVLAVEKISNDEEVRSLKETIADTEVNLIQLRSKFQDQHPKIQRLKTVLADAQKEIAKRYSALIGRVDPKFDGISANDDVQHQLLEDMVEARSEIVAGESKAASLASSLQELKARISAMPKKQQEYADLSRQDDLTTNTLTAIESELQRVKLTESVSLSSSRLQVIESSQGVTNLTASFWRVAYLSAFAAAVVTIVLQVLLDPRLKSAGPLKSLGIVGYMPKLKGGLEQAVQCSDRIRLAIRGWLTRSKVIWITSPSQNDGKSLIAHALAESFCDAGERVLLVDAQLEQPKLHVLLNETASPGLCQYLYSEASSQAIVRDIRPNLSFVPAGGLTSDLRLLSSTQFRDFLRMMEQSFDVIIVDSIAAGLDEHRLRLSDVEPNVLIVGRIGNTFKQDLKLLSKQLEMLPVSEHGIVVNEISIKRLGNISNDNASTAVASNDPEPAQNNNTKQLASADW